MGNVEKSATVAAIDTVLKTFFYYFHESCYDKAEKKGWKLCTDYETDGDTDDDIDDNNQINDNNKSSYLITSV